jgi:hypothetical protein
MTKLLENLKSALEQAIKEDLPIYITEKVEILINDFQKYSEKKDLIEELTERLEYYDPFGNAGCFNIAYSAEDIENILSEILK